MAEFVKGELITAYKLREINSSKRHEAITDDELNIYIHSGGYIEWTATGVGEATGIVEIKKWNGSSYDQVFYQAQSGGYSFLGGSPSDKSSSGTFYVDSNGGEGYYNIRCTNTMWMYTPSSSGSGGTEPSITFFGSSSAYIYPIISAYRGEYLVQYDISNRSGNRIKGEVLTAEILNSGTVSTIPSLT